MLNVPLQEPAQPQHPEVSSLNRARKLQREPDSSQASALTNQPPKRVKRQYRSRRSNEDDLDHETRTFGCPTCLSLSKNMDEWYSHQKRRHFPTDVWICGGAGQKSCKVILSKRRDNFRNHLLKSHGFVAGLELDAEVKKRAVKVTGLFHEKCGFCQQDLSSWENSMLHIWEHVEIGAKMSDWSHVCGTEHELQANIHYKVPPEHSGPSEDSFDEDDPNDDGPDSGGGAGDKFDFGSYGDFDNLNFDQDFNGGFYNPGGKQDDQHNTYSPGSYQYRTNSPNSRVTEVVEYNSQQPETEPLLSEQSFIFVRELGSGSSGHVVEVMCKDPKQNFALKIIRQSHHNAKASSKLAAFTNEIKMLKMLRHPHIVRFVGSRISGDALFILMHPVADTDLATYLHRSDLKLALGFPASPEFKTASDVLFASMQCLTSAVSYIHSLDIIHGDLKPENVIFNGTKVLLIDFASAKNIPGGTDSIQHICTSSSDFTAPEVTTFGLHDLSADIWSLGCILALILTRSMGRTLQDFDDFRSSSGHHTSFHDSLHKVVEWLQLLEAIHRRENSSFTAGITFDTVCQMISEDPSARPTAHQVWDSMQKNFNCQCVSASKGSEERSPDNSISQIVDHTPQLDQPIVSQRRHTFNFNHEEAAAAFRDFEKSLEEFTVKPAHKRGRSYVLSQSLVKWLTSPWPGHTFTQADRLHKAVYHKISGFDPISAEQLSTEPNRCLLVFSILLVLHKGALVDRFQRRGIVDSHIPMSLERLQKGIRGMELSKAEASSLANDFYAKQWLFCPIIFCRDMDRYYEKEHIMPICQKQKINDKAGSATGIYLIEIQEQFVDNNLRAVADRYQDKKDGFGCRYQFALKTFHESNLDLFKNETQAFKALKDHKGMVQYLGEYTHESHQVSGTSNVSDKTYNILLEYGDLDLDEYFFERRPPLFSTEILRFWGDLFEVGDAIKGVHNLNYGKGELVEEYYGWHADIKPDNILSVHGKFKLADLGFAHFVKKTDEIPMGKILGGTETFSAPECHPSRRKSSNTVHQTIDIWSLGCVFSIAATWVVLGYQGILQYAEFRKNAIKKLKVGQLEPDGSEQNDFSNKSKDCFHNRSEVLPEVTSWHKSLRAKLRKTDTVTALVLDLIDHSMLLGDPTKRLSARETCAELRRIYKEAKEAQVKIDEKVPEMIMDALRQLDDSARVKVLPKTLSEKSAPDLHIANTKSKRFEDPLMKTTHRSEVFLVTPHQMPLVLGGIDENQPLETVPLHEDDALQTSPLLRPHAQLLNPPFSRFTAADQNAYDVSQGKAPKSFEYPNMSRVRQRLPPQKEFEVRTQDERSSNGLLGKVLSRHFIDRDLVFLVDNAATMRQYWSQATLLLEKLVMKAEEVVPDGPDLRFTIGMHELKAETRVSAFKEAMKHAEAIPRDLDVTNIKASLGKIFEQYLERPRDQYPILNNRALTIIVLTDGLWQGMGVKVDQHIVKFLRQSRRRTNSVIRRLLSIEIIQFGNDLEATKRLRNLDDDLKAQGIEDVIHIEPCDGGLEKMLLERLIENYDGEENELELGHHMG